MLTAPYHFGIVACSAVRKSQPPSDGELDDTQSGILYRGSIPAARNLPFLRSLGLKTIVVCKKKPLGETEVLVRWAAKHGVEVKWVKADIMTEESLGMGRAEVSELLKVRLGRLERLEIALTWYKYILDTSLYPLYIADVDGISHTTLIVACLRKLQGWHMDSIMGEVERYVWPFRLLRLHWLIVCTDSSRTTKTTLSRPLSANTSPPAPRPTHTISRRDRTHLGSGLRLLRPPTPLNCLARILGSGTANGRAARHLQHYCRSLTRWPPGNTPRCGYRSRYPRNPWRLRRSHSPAHLPDVTKTP